MASRPYDIFGAEADASDGAEGEPQKPASVPGRTGSPYMREMRRANVLLVILFVGGAGAVYALSLRKGPATASAEQQLVEHEIDSAILRLTQKAPASPAERGAGALTRDLAENFYADIRERQVPLNELAKDPFVFVEPPKAPTAEPAATKAATGDPAPEAPTPAQQNRDRMMAALARLRLQSVMMGTRGGGTALISNNLLTVGQDIEGFTIKAIESKSVVLTWRDEEFVLKMP